mmetsp:Transcript_7808/g.20375  ORF Transcript_7808/g.20375 Transcript_7808/m.20375 type:complete len:246 (+) Transcript_7808:58-795(+)
MGCGQAKEPKGKISGAIPKGKPVLHYFDVSGRGELSKLIAAVGGVELEVVEYPFQANGASVADKAKAGAMESEHTKAAKAMSMEGCGLPILVHGSLKINQSAAVQDYLMGIGPTYPRVNPVQKAKDDMFEGALEDAMGLGAGIVLSGYDGSLMVPFMEKTLTHLSKYIPESGFVNGFDAPTKADLVILILTQALIPFKATLGEYDFAKFPKAKALGERTAAFPAVAKWLEHEHCNLKKPPKAARG